jgi:hypothetical protein
MEARHAAVIIVGIVSLSPVLAVSSTSGIGSHTTAVTIDSGRTATNIGPTEVTQRAPPDPATDVIGWERGYWYNESITVDQADGLSESELDAFLARSMARVEHIRQLEFTERVTIEFVHREELDAPRNDTYGLTTSEQLWEALFIYGENANASRAVRRSQRSVVLGFAAEEGSDHIVIVDPIPQQPTVSGGTLIHELAHMLQDQQFNLSRPRYQRHTLDGEFAKDGLIEGAAAYITDRYRMNCRGTWKCVEAPSDGISVQRPGPFRFYRLTYFPYSAGEVYVRALIEQGGWKAVTAAHEQPPVSTEQVIHPSRMDQPISMTFSNTARNGWTRLDRRPETIGEAGIYMLFWRRSAEDSPISEANLSRSGPSVGIYNYVSQLSTGWGNDHLYTYANGDKRGYVWKTVWDTERDAREFREAYIAILKEEGATQRGPHTWRIDDDPFADAFSVQRTGTVVTIVNGPTLAALDDIYPATTITGEQPNTTIGTDGKTANTTTATTGPGFGGLVALVAVMLAGFALHNRI